VAAPAPRRRASFAFLDLFGLLGLAEAAEHRLFDGAEDVLIARAAAEVAGELLAQLVVRVLDAGVQNLGRGHDEARGAEAALNGGLVHKGLLDVGDLAVRAHEPLERQYVLALGPRGEVEAGVDGLAVDEHVARAALADLAALLDGGQAEVVAQHVREARAHVDHLFNGLAVDGAFDKLVLCHYSSPPQRLTDSTRQRRAISTAMCWRNALDARHESRG